MAKVEMGRDAEAVNLNNRSEADEFLNTFVNDDASEELEGYDEWLEIIRNSENPREEIFKKIKESVSEDDQKCMDMILEYMNQGNKFDIVEIEKMLEPSFPDINPIAVFQYVILLSGAGLIKLEE